MAAVKRKGLWLLALKHYGGYFSCSVWCSESPSPLTIKPAFFRIISSDPAAITKHLSRLTVECQMLYHRDRGLCTRSTYGKYCSHSQVAVEVPPFISEVCALHTEMYTNTDILRQHAGCTDAQILKSRISYLLTHNECPHHHKKQDEPNTALSVLHLDMWNSSSKINSPEQEDASPPMFWIQFL